MRKKKNKENGTLAKSRGFFFFFLIYLYIYDFFKYDSGDENFSDDDYAAVYAVIVGVFTPELICEPRGTFGTTEI